MSNLSINELNRFCTYATQSELDYMRDKMAKTLAPGARVVMIGAGPGVLLLSLLEGYRDSGLQIIVIDIETTHWMQEHLRQATADPITALINPSYTKSIVSIVADSADHAAFWRGGAIDLLIVDGDHSEDGVRSDMAGWLPHVAKGGLVFFHDMDFTGTLWEDEYRGKLYPPVAPAVEEVMRITGATLLDRPGSSAVYRMPE